MIRDLKPYTDKNCVVDNATEDAYFSLQAMSYSGLKEMKKGPGYFKWAQDNPDNEDTAARLLGRLVHLAIGEPNRFASEVIAIDGNRNTNVVKDQIAQAEASGKIVTKTDVLDQVRRVSDFVRAHPIVKQLMSEGRPEQAMLWKDPETGVQCKGRADWLRSDSDWIIADWKTFDQLDESSIERQIRSMGYQYQAGFYSEGASVISGLDVKMFANVFIRTKDPIDCRVVILSDHDIEEARVRYRLLLQQYAKCLAENHWPMSSQEPMQLVLKSFWD